jgi:pimeloyl-ACP methyl ester carboxylesterase
MQLPRVILMGHSWGSLIALAAAAQLGERISHLVLIGTASPMTVAPALLDLAQNDPAQAIALIDKYSRSPVTPADFDGQALGHAVLASNPATNLLHCGLTACNSYHEAPVAMQQVTAPTLFMTGEYDRMTPAAAAQPLIAAAQSRTPQQGNAPTTHVVTLACGHQHMLDATPALVQALADFVRS